MTVAIQQTHAEYMLKIGDDLRHDWLRNGEMPGCLRHASAFGHSEQDMEVTELDAPTDAVRPFHLALTVG
jgi:hypothetical protein